MVKRIPAIALTAILLVYLAWFVPARASRSASDPRLGQAYRFERGGWIYAHLEGPPAQIGYQHGYLLAKEISDAFAAVKLKEVHATSRDWEFFRDTAKNVLWPHVDDEYRQELEGITEGAKAGGASLDLWDVVALNAMEEVTGYYVPWLESQQFKKAIASRAPDHCSAFVATGSWTKDGKIVIAHNNWTSYLDGTRWRVMFDIVPSRGNRMLMDGFPGLIASDDDFGISASGLMVTETTIGDFVGFDPGGKPEFMRARKALQYANSIDDYVRIMNDGNNGGYANDWLLGDRKTGEIARFEQGLKHTPLWRTKDGYFEGANYASDPQVLKQETRLDINDLSLSPNARRVRWLQLLQRNRGQIDVLMAERFLADHYDSFTKLDNSPSERTLCGHIELSPRGFKGWLPAFYPGGAVQNKVTDSSLAAHLSLIANMGHACGRDFKAKPFLERHPQFSWQAPALDDLDTGGWMPFAAGERK
jgi:hypothetical protein